VTMYYPMRAIRTREYKLIWNVAHELEYPHADDLWHSPTWQGILRRKDGRMGRRTVEAYLRRPQYELYDVRRDADEITNLAADPKHGPVLMELRARLRKMMEETKDPWVIMFRDEKSD